MIPAGSIILVAVYIACELVANITAAKTISLFGMSAPGGVLIYAITFTLIDLVNERLGKTGARKVVIAGFTANVILALYTSLIVALPSPVELPGNQAFATVFSSTPRIVAASLAAYLVSSFIDVEIFARWRERMGARHKWARVLASNTVSTFVDSLVFVGLAFAGTLPVLPLVLGQYVLKMVITVTSLPLIYATGRMKHGSADGDKQ
jgi:queuosine precursor transporter